MSTGATIQFNGMTYFQSHDGYPSDVIPKMEQIVKEVKKIMEKNLKLSLVGGIEAILTESEDLVCSAVNGFPADYSFSIDKDGNVTQTGAVKDSYGDGICPDCAEDISDNAVNGDECENCGHVFYAE